jgi:hypothetical protein
MKNFKSGQKSSNQTCAQKFVQIFFILLTVSLLHFGAKASSPDPTAIGSPSDCPRVSILQVSSNDPIAIGWSVTVSLSCSIGGGEVSTQSLWTGQQGFEGFSDATTTASNGGSITYHLYGGTLPGGADVAVISLLNDNCGENHFWQVTTDGSGTMLILDEY